MDLQTPTPAAAPTDRLSLASLPNEILDHIFSLLPVPTARLCRLLSHRFLPSSTRASFPVLVVSPLLSDAHHLQLLANSPAISPCLRSIYYITDTLASPRWRRLESSSTLDEEIAPEDFTWSPTDHPRNWLPHYVHHPQGSGRIDLLSAEWYQHRYRPLISHHRRSADQIALDRQRYEDLLLDQAQFLAEDHSPNRDYDGIVMCWEQFPALEHITIEACRELSLAAPLNSVALHSDRNPFRYAPWRTAFPSISTPETEERVLRSLVRYLEIQSVVGKGKAQRLKTLRIKNLSWCVLDDPGIFFSPIVEGALANLTTLEIQIRHGNPIHMAAKECIPPMSQARLSHVMSSGNVRAFLKSLTNLRHLTFERDRIWYREEHMIPEGDGYRWSLGDIIDPESRWPHLQSLSLSHFNDCEREDIEQIMDNHADTLWKVSLGDANLRTTLWVNLVDYFYQENQRRIAGYDGKPLYHLELWGCLRGTREKDITGQQQPGTPDHTGEREKWAFWRGDPHSWELARYVYGIEFQESKFAWEHRALYARIIVGEREEGLGGLEN
ncbi:hypothetical protein NEUTE1DRAFT_45543 [Neurospora tetrasperma FGSC 2508]|uniref:F-box domain-containing protein n=1 Tax=Neurospora tetrasperma (strain FGSC 2508 / ATCC MYA-4615 / P0657) TaxID=510951 RepID=F8MNT4_NEUT8|nr:uncharacterized protein NEUTE1DRAFT_45543 [Neurospora tetrasperma FGSC 2508]EGO56206.1 hypothetical protein NEUTE1DRAFT_45543 [Neurospora tetrasperma FGSC 2508]EGZ70938.1 hypothetical protein NEUTE2DRAFT_69632 [Neurospora tetrasperma FGSC 2509]